jgi:Bor protein
MSKKLLSVLGALALASFLTGCNTLVHEVGRGAQGHDEVEKRQWYALWGLVPLGEVDSHAMAKGATDYTVTSEHTIIDILLNLITTWVTINSQTVTVEK